MAENRVKYFKFEFESIFSTKNIPVKPLKDLLEDTLTANIISPVLRSFFHNASKHPAIWSNTASIVLAKQPDMIAYPGGFCCKTFSDEDNASPTPVAEA
ncbi:7742_t:CDS:2, partial [Funneliformis mosseae]